MPPQPCINIAGSYLIYQSKGSFVNVTWTQEGNQLGGNASIQGRNIKSKSLKGTVVGEHVDFTVHWDDGHEGHYWGDLFEPHNHVAWQGWLAGDCKDMCHQYNWSHWRVENVTFMGLQPHHPVNTANW